VGVGAQVYADGLLACRQRLRVHLGDEDDVPMLAFPLNRRRLDLPFQRAVELDSGSPLLGEGERVVAPLPLEAGVSRLTLLGLDPPEEALEGFVHPVKKILEHLGVDPFVLGQFLSYLGQVPILFVEADSPPGLLVSISTLLRGGVVQLTAKLKCLLQVFHLGLGGVQALFEGFAHGWLLLHGTQSVSTCGVRGGVHVSPV